MLASPCQKLHIDSLLNVVIFIPISIESPDHSNKILLPAGPATKYKCLLAENYEAQKFSIKKPCFIACFSGKKSNFVNNYGAKLFNSSNPSVSMASMGDFQYFVLFYHIMN